MIHNFLTILTFALQPHHIKKNGYNNLIGDAGDSKRGRNRGLIQSNITTFAYFL